MKDDAISRQAALRTDCFGDGHEGLRAFHVYEDYKKMRDYIEALPSVQPEITYCKDCLFGHFYADIINGVMDTWVECRNPDGLNRDVSVDGYCYAAIRRERNETD